MALSVQQQVFWFKVPVHDIARVQIVQGAHDLTGVEVAGDVVEVPHVPQVEVTYTYKT